MSITVEKVLARLPELQSKLHQNTVLYVMVLAANEERRALLNRQFDLGGVRYAHTQQNSNGSVILNTFVFPFNFDSRMFKSRHCLMVILDSRIEPAFKASLIEDADMQQSVNRTLTAVAHQLGVSIDDLLISITV